MCFLVECRDIPEPGLFPRRGWLRRQQTVHGLAQCQRALVHRVSVAGILVCPPSELTGQARSEQAGALAPPGQIAVAEQEIATVVRMPRIDRIREV
jgi:hypothetical protein